ncbi:MAG: hypothetical protein E6R04_07355 [Spirochaetes bacterium]|nr:MAG: hypothetical protein E6R04_07355 [Spirochaetota bacterium]
MTMTTLTPENVSKIEELAPKARLARRQHGEDDPKVVASKELTALLKELREEGHSISVLASAANMTYHSVSARIKS